MTLHLDLGVRRAEFHLEARFDVEPGEIVALLGPNGAGKTTVLRALAGLSPLASGRITLTDTGEDGGGELVLDDPVADILVPPERRPIGVVFQEYLLFEHLDALENVAFGLRARGTDRHEARRRAQHWLDRVDIGELARRRPSQLSGGQAQRVALARALATDPSVLLLDEPLAALDAATRSSVRRDLRHHLQGFTGMRLLVTHDPVDAHLLADRVIVLEDGRIVQQGTMPQVTAQPRSRYVADLVGVNLVRGHHDRGQLVTTSGAILTVAGGELPTGPAHAAIRPASVALHRTTPDGSARNVWNATVVSIDQHLDRVRVATHGPIDLIAEVTPAGLAHLDLEPGSSVVVAVKATEIDVYADSDDDCTLATNRSRHG